MARAVYLYGLLFTAEEWQDADLQSELMSTWAQQANDSADHEAYESFEIVVTRQAAA